MKIVKRQKVKTLLVHLKMEVSNCCNEKIIENTNICSKCKEPCEIKIKEEE